MKFKIFLLLFISLATSVFAEKSVLFITDNVSLSDSFNMKYTKSLQDFIDKDFGKDKIVLKDFSKFGINTTQCIELCNMLSRQNNSEAIILMVGLSNYHNLYGFSSYMKSIGNIRLSIKESNLDIREINNKMLKIYSFAKETILSMVYKKITGTQTKVFKPKVIPTFYALDNNFNTDNNIVASVETYKKSRELIKEKKFDEAKTLLQSALNKNPAQSMLHYALGSVYLAEDKDSQSKALQCFEEGILVDPLNTNNICYKGLSLIYMMYQGNITSEVLYFAKELDKYLPQTNEDVDAILSINTVDYNKKMEYINDWILSDINKLEKFSYKSNIKLIFLGYPKEDKINNLISNYVKNSSRIMFLDTDNNSTLDTYVMAEKTYKFLKENNVLKK
jgi:tetratricopeptide (TPR) repeat protein